MSGHPPSNLAAPRQVRAKRRTTTVAGVPRSTLRLQFHKDFTFEAAREQLPYFARLGVSHLYASPILTARAGSAHGYDIVDHGAINPELGGEDSLRRLIADLRGRGMGLIVDIVPNHMAVGRHDNRWWQDVLLWGRDSRYANFFDIDWDVPDPELRGRLLAPFLGKPYGEALASGELALRFDADAGSLHFAYYEHHFPLSMESCSTLLRPAGEPLAGLAARFRGPRQDRGTRRQVYADACAALADVCRTAAGAEAMRRLLAHYSGAGAADRLHRLLQRQHYRLAWWRTAADEINWRRFFDVIDLAGLRVQERAVFEAVHSTLFRLYGEGLIDGFRVDHIDGLADPREYCRRLRMQMRRLARERPDGTASGSGYLVVEKILAPGEMLNLEWQTDGTSGYVFMNQAGALLHDPAGESALREGWSSRSGRTADFGQEERSARRRISLELLGADFNACAHALHFLARANPRTRDWTLGAVRRVLLELLVHFPVYRTYTDGRGRSVDDSRIMHKAIAAAQATCRPGEAPLLELVDGWLGAMPAMLAPAAERRARLRAIARFQQLTSPVAAKSVEDTAFYRHGTLLSRNEVGADPAQFAMSVEEFHRACAERLERYPAAMLATATHDHKRGEDLRARLAVISEIPQQWAEAVARWSALAAPLKRKVGKVHGPDATDEYMLYQMLTGAWPLDADWRNGEDLAALCRRLADWQLKAVREAKRHSGWVEPNLDYENACRQFLERLLDPLSSAAFLQDLSAFVDSIAAAGAVNGLSQTLLRLTTPGVPDLYQGCEWWDFSLVDPDNRRPVDFAARAAALGERPPMEFLDNWRDGRIKQHLITTLLELRRRKPALFSRGSYLPLEVAGAAAEHFVAFARQESADTLIVLAPRRPHSLLVSDGLTVRPGAWGATQAKLPGDFAQLSFRQVLTEGTVDSATGLHLESALGNLPLAVLLSEGRA